MLTLAHRRARRGLGLFEGLLALALLGTGVLGVSVFFETLAGERRARAAAVHLDALAGAVADHVHGRFPDLLAAARLAPSEITASQLRASGSLPADFPAEDALGRAHRVLILAVPGADALDVLATQTVLAGDTAFPAGASLAARGAARMGVVLPGTPPRLSGPALDYDVSAFRAAFAGAPAAGAVAALRRFDREGVYGGRLQRAAVPGFPEANRMETDLDMGGNAVTGVGLLSAETLALSGDLDAAGDLRVVGELTVGEAVRVSGPVRAVGALTAQSAIFTGEASSASLAVTGELRAGSVSATGSVSAGSFDAAGAVTAGSVAAQSVAADGISARTVTASSLSGAVVRATNLRVDTRLDAVSAGFSTLVVGRCTGCGP